MIIGKVRSFGGRVEELGLTTVLAVFGVDPVEDAPARASLAALAILKAARHDRTTGNWTPSIRLALHVHQIMVNHGVAVARIDVDGKQAACGTLDVLIRRGEPDTILISEAAAPFLERRFALEAVATLSDEGGRAYRLLRRNRRASASAGGLSPLSWAATAS